MAKAVQLGRSLKALRAANGWSLAEVSRRTSISISTLSKVENGLLSLTYDKLIGLSEGLDVDVSVFFNKAGINPDPTPLGRRSLDDIGGGEIIDTPNYQYRYLHTDLSNKQLIPVIVEHTTRTIEDFGPLVKHTGEEFVHVLSGRIEVHTELYAPKILGPGESVYIDSNMGHAYLCVSEEPAQTLSVCVSDPTQSADDHPN
ncbi:XRE family transcriptional regulator [uncultured Algimonas sp.]|uniref:helix-turn-helix domain-containing protein n=1 Tax=uncultured Algimonas sp. TaxID=1547920 RepID=UPI00263748B0|nr:XRE family transcriptional regulator [uncultured Algimonas sp.]